MQAQRSFLYLPCGLLIGCLLAVVVTSSAWALAIDDLSIGPVTNPLVAPMGGVATDNQTGLPGASVLGGSRLIRVTSDMAFDNIATRVESLMAGGLDTFAFTAGLYGGSLDLEYDLPVAQDFTFGSAAAVPARIRVGTTQMKAGKRSLGVLRTRYIAIPERTLIKKVQKSREPSCPPQPAQNR